MLTDRELLELAAKAAKLELPRYVLNTSWGTGISHGKDDQVYSVWNPLTDDGDALRLAVKLNIDLEMLLSTIRAKSFFGCTVTEEKGKDALAATRLAIVRAAAEIGRAM